MFNCKSEFKYELQFLYTLDDFNSKTCINNNNNNNNMLKMIK